MSLLTIAEIYQKFQALSRLKEIKVQGWVKSVRRSKNINFIVLNDGSCLQNLQIVCVFDLAEINFGSCLIAKGKLSLTPERTQTFELQVQSIEFINPTMVNYPLQKQTIPLEEVRKHLHLRAKT